MGLPLINKIKAIISTHQLLLQYERDDAKVKISRHYKKSARECLINTLKNGEPVQECGQKRKLEEASILNIQTPRQRPEPPEKYDVDLWGKGELIKIGTNVKEETKQEILSVISEYQHIFPFNVSQMPGTIKEVMCHKLNIQRGYKPVKQKQRYQGKERVEAAKAKVQNLLKATNLTSNMDTSLSKKSIDIKAKKR